VKEVAQRKKRERKAPPSQSSGEQQKKGRQKKVSSYQRSGKRAKDKERRVVEIWIASEDVKTGCSVCKTQRSIEYAVYMCL
jgi:hypothetical protein